MGLTDYLQILRKFWISITAVTLMGLAVGAIASLLATPTYTSSVSVYLTVQSGDSAADLSQGSSYTERQVKSFAQIIEAPVVLQPVVDQLQLGISAGQLAGRVTVQVPANTSILNISVVDTDANRAAATARATGDQLIKTVANLSPKSSSGQATVIATVITPATVPTSWTTPRVAQNLALGLLLGLLVGVGQAVLRRVLDTKVRNAEDIAKVTDVPVVATMAYDPETKKHPLPVITDPYSLHAEEFRRLRTNLQFLGVGPRGGAIAFSSSLNSEGKTTTVLNTAIALAQAGKRVLLIDADLRRPRVAPRLNLESNAGLSTILVGRAHLEDVVQPVHGVDVLAAGRVPPNPSELLGSSAMRDLITEGLNHYDWVLVDTAPVGMVADTAVLASAVGGVLLVVESGRGDVTQLEDSITAVQTAEGRVMGIVLNKLKAEDAGSRRSRYYGEAYGDVAAPEAPTRALDEPQPDATPARAMRSADLAAS
ncbi:polysaccharide biosynthesis tyrosine autokinase [Propionibacteriaceae bacterium G1746]